MLNTLHASHRITTRSVCAFHGILFYIISYHISQQSILGTLFMWESAHQKPEAPAITVQVLSNGAFIKPKACAPTATERLFNTGATDLLSKFVRCYGWISYRSKGDADFSHCPERIKMPKKETTQQHILSHSELRMSSLPWVNMPNHVKLSNQIHIDSQ